MRFRWPANPKKRRRSFSRATLIKLAVALFLACEALYLVTTRFAFARPPAAVVVDFARTLFNGRCVRGLSCVGNVVNAAAPLDFPEACADVLGAPRWREWPWRYRTTGSHAAFMRRLGRFFGRHDATPNATTCSARLCRALQQWAQLAREREPRTKDDSLKDDPLKDDSLKGDPLPEEEVARQQAAGVGQVCTEAWRSGVMARVGSSKFIRRLVAEGETSLASITAGIDAVCAPCKHVEATLLDRSSNATSACGDWPEECWPVPRMPFSSLSDFPRRKYLVFAMSEEQLSNARTHIVEAARLARMANRILVLPNASRSHLSLGRALPLCTYWDFSQLSAEYEWVSPHFFLLLARATLANPSVGFVWVESPYLNRTVFHYDRVTDFLGQLLAFSAGHVPLESNTLQVRMPAAKDDLARMLQAWRERDIVVWFKTTWERVHFDRSSDDLALPLLPYRSDHHATAARLLALLPRPLIAMHFRSEFVAFRVQDDTSAGGEKANASMLQQRLEWCGGEAENLITQVKASLTHPSSAAPAASTTAANSGDLPSSSGGTSSSSSSSGGGGSSRVSVFIAADVPFNASTTPARSDSWEETVQAYGGDQLVAQLPLAALRRLRENVNGTVMIDELMPHVNTLDPGIVGILDKLVCAHADVFLAGSWNCGGGRGYESDIVRHRRQLNYSDDTLTRWGEG
ncbi:hypothetical protein CLOP_g10750 [Closterium sp. NIES-67]|nr:hypothetical protein CLOP_g20963 [Closterium sp. NIES-67]GJP80545.1 hypothetical protein CLOP_g10750 [Closterium sp. NIES-67]